MNLQRLLFCLSIWKKLFLTSYLDASGVIWQNLSLLCQKTFSKVVLFEMFRWKSPSNYSFNIGSICSYISPLYRVYQRLELNLYILFVIFDHFWKEQFLWGSRDNNEIDSSLKLNHHVRKASRNFWDTLYDKTVCVFTSTFKSISNACEKRLI